MPPDAVTDTELDSSTTAELFARLRAGLSPDQVDDLAPLVDSLEDDMAELQREVRTLPPGEWPMWAVAARLAAQAEELVKSSETPEEAQHYRGEMAEFRGKARTLYRQRDHSQQGRVVGAVSGMERARARERGSGRRAQRRMIRRRARSPGRSSDDPSEPPDLRGWLSRASVRMLAHERRRFGKGWRPAT
jgi:hypothetical protein